MKIKLTQDHIDLLKMGNVTCFANGNTYYYLPFWFKIDSNGEVETYIEALPEELTEKLKRNREHLKLTEIYGNN